MDDIVRSISHSYIFPGVIFTIMFGLGMTMSLTMFRDVLVKPRALLTGLAGQLVLLPLLAFTIAMLGPWSSLVALGLIVIAVCPGGSTSNAIVFAIRGDVALSVSLTALSSVLTLITIPPLLGLALHLWGGGAEALLVPVSQVVRGLLLMTALPVCLGMLLRHYAPALTDRMREPFRKASLVMLLSIIALSIYNSRGYISAEMGQIAAASSALVAAVISGGWTLAKLLRLPRDQRLTIAIEIGVQNTALALFIGASLLNLPELTVVAIAYGIINYALIGALIVGLRRSDPERVRASAT